MRAAPGSSTPSSSSPDRAERSAASDQGIAAARVRLTAERERLERLAAGLRHDEEDASGTPEPLGVHLADAGSDLFERERVTSLRDDVAIELDEVRLAFERLESGRYGKCEHCGGVIPDERLEAMPAARLCVLHEERFELRAGRAVGAAGRLAAGRTGRSAAADEAFLPTEDEDDTSSDESLSAEEAAMRLVDESEVESVLESDAGFAGDSTSDPDDDSDDDPDDESPGERDWSGGRS